MHDDTSFLPVIHGIAFCGWRIVLVYARYALCTRHRLQTARVNDNDVLYCVFVADFRLKFCHKQSVNVAIAMQQISTFCTWTRWPLNQPDIFDTREQRGKMSGRRRGRGGIWEWIDLFDEEKSIDWIFIYYFWRNDRLCSWLRSIHWIQWWSLQRVPDVIFNWILLVYAHDMALGGINTKHHIHRPPHFYQNYHDY